MSPSSAATFGDLLRQHRLALGLTQEALAERDGLSVHGIQKLERGATHPYRDTAQRLVLALELLPDDQARFRAAVQPVRRHSAAHLSAPDSAARHNLPGAISRLIGRQQDQVEVARRLAGTRLLTLTGIGGCGKTRLAFEVARSVIADYPDGVWLVELGPLADPALVPHQVGTVLGVREVADESLANSLTSALASRRLLLVLDNCEHMLQACAVLVDILLRACPKLRILATSREPIGIDGEVAWRVPSLPVPDPESTPSLAELQESPAVQLFMDRATAAQPRFALTARNAAAVAQICQRLDGIPLALELAAARVDGLTAEQLALRLDQRFRLLTGGSRTALPRQQTLEATLDWSYARLSKAERRLFERLAVFAGGWTVEAAEAVCADRGVSRPPGRLKVTDRLALEDVLDLLLQLVRKSLVVATADEDGAVRYGSLETVREYARHKLAARGMAGTAALRDRHAVFYSALAEQLPPAMPAPLQGTLSGDPLAVLRRGLLEEMHDNLRAALGWWLEAGRAVEGLSLSVSMWPFWMWRGSYAEARRWFEPMLDLANRTATASGAAMPPVPAVPLALQARAGYMLGMLALFQGDYAPACAFLDASVARWREHDDPALASGLAVLGLVVALAGDAERATAVLAEGLSLSRAVGDQRIVAQSLRHLGMVARWQGQYELAAALLRESVDEARSLSSNLNHLIARSVSNLGRVAYLQGDCHQARALFREALEVIREPLLVGQALSDCLDWLAAVEGALGQGARAALLFGAAEAQWRASGGVRYAPDRPAYEHDVASVRAQLDEHAFEAAWAAGRAMSAEQAVAYALEQTNPSVSTQTR